ncbi:MAG: DUF4397 domain-containing protein [Persicimonas sp.]
MKDLWMMRRGFYAVSAVVASLLVAGSIGCSDPEDDGFDGDAGDVGDADRPDTDDDDDDDGIDGPSAELQLIHEAPDPGLESVQVTIEGESLDEELDFRSATDFVAVEADTQVTVAVSGESQEAEFDVELDEDDTAIGVLHGVTDPDEVPLASEDRDAQLDLEVLENARDEPSGGADEAVAFHASPDAPTVDLIADRDDTLVDELEYAEFSEYVELPEGVTTLDLVNTGDERHLDAFQTPDLDGNQSFTVVASGFLDVEESDRPELALMAYPPEGGEGVAFEQAARLQIVHNSPDPQIGAVDISVGDETIGEGVEYREASATTTFVSETDLDVEIRAEDDGEDPIFEETLQLAEGGSFIGVATGFVDAESFAENPDGEETDFELAISNMRETATDGDEVDVRAFHGATDAPAVDLVDAGDDDALIEGLGYGEFSDRLALEPASYDLEFVPADNGETVGTTTLDLSDAAANAFNVVVSGLVEPPDELQADAGLALVVVSPAGEVDILELDP